MPAHARKHGLRCQASATAAKVSTDEAVATLKQASSDSKVSPKKVFNAMRTLQKAKLPGEEWGPIFACNEHWRLVYTAKPTAVTANLKDPEAGNGSFFPVVAAQKWNLTSPKDNSGNISNGLYLPHLASLVLEGTYEYKKGNASFNFDTVKLKIGPFVLGPIKVPSQEKDGRKPFFKMLYVDEDIVCALGRSGGLAFWAKAEPTFIAEKGIM